MIPFVYFFSFFSKSSSVAYTVTTISAISVLFLCEIVENNNFKKNVLDKNSKNGLFRYNDKLSLFLSFLPYTYVYKFFYRVLKMELLRKVIIDLQYSHFHSEWFCLFMMGTVFLILIITKIFFIDKINTSNFDNYISKIFNYKTLINNFNDIDVLEEKEFTEKLESFNNYILIIMNLRKIYYSFFNKNIKVACKDVSFTLRNNEVYLYIIVFWVIRKKWRWKIYNFQIYCWRN